MCEDAPCCGCCGVAPSEVESDPMELQERVELEQYTHFGPDDDLADYNQAEADDYRDE